MCCVLPFSDRPTSLTLKLASPANLIKMSDAIIIIVSCGIVTVVESVQHRVFCIFITFQLTAAASSTLWMRRTRAPTLILWKTTRQIGWGSPARPTEGIYESITTRRLQIWNLGSSLCDECASLVAAFAYDYESLLPRYLLGL